MYVYIAMDCYYLPFQRRGEYEKKRDSAIVTGTKYFLGVQGNIILDSVLWGLKTTRTMHINTNVTASLSRNGTFCSKLSQLNKKG